jgi:hypothetical protein
LNEVVSGQVELATADMPEGQLVWLGAFTRNVVLAGELSNDRSTVFTKAIPLKPRLLAFSQGFSTL